MKNFLLRSFILFSLLIQTKSLAEVVVNLEEKSVESYRDEIEAVSELISIQQKHLLRQKELKDLMIEFKLQKQSFINGNQTQRHARAMVSNAREILAIISEEHINHLFSEEYLEELVFFSSVAGKSKPLRP